MLFKHILLQNGLENPESEVAFWELLYNGWIKQKVLQLFALEMMNVCANRFLFEI